MAFDPGLAQLLREDLADVPFTEQKMFGGLCYLTHGHMICGLHKGGTMYRVGKGRQAQALALPGTRTMRMGKRTMAGMIELSPEESTDDTRRHALLDLALATVRDLPPKVANPEKG